MKTLFTSLYILLYVGLFFNPKLVLSPKNTNKYNSANYCEPSGWGNYFLARASFLTSCSELSYTKQGSLEDWGATNNYKLINDINILIKPGEEMEIMLVHENHLARSLVWIDWNRDGDFSDPLEIQKPFGLASKASAADKKAIYEQTIKVPLDAVQGTSRMRILTGDAWTYESIPSSTCMFLRASSIVDITITIE